MSQVTDILVSIDTETILEKFQLSTDPAKPTGISNSNVYMIVHRADAISGQAGGELRLKAEVGDDIRWRETSLSLGFENSVIFYKFDPMSGGDLISPPTPLKAVVTEPAPNDSDLLKPGRQQVNNYFWRSTALETGSVTYRFFFMIVARDGTLKGCCCWDPHITISN